MTVEQGDRGGVRIECPCGFTAVDTSGLNPGAPQVAYDNHDTCQWHTQAPPRETATGIVASWLISLLTLSLLWLVVSSGYWLWGHAHG